MPVWLRFREKITTSPTTGVYPDSLVLYALLAIKYERRFGIPGSLLLETLYIRQ